MVTESSPKPKPHPFASLAGVAGAVAGAALARYSGLNLLIPAVAGIVIGVIANKLIVATTRPMLFAIAVQGGHAAWMLVGMVALISIGAHIPQVLMAVGLDLVILIGGVTWLLLRPGIGPVVLLTIYQAVVLVLNGLQIGQVPVSSPEHRALVVHMLLRVLAVVGMMAGLKIMKRQESAEPLDPTPTPLQR